MKIIYNNYIPFKGFSAINLFGVLFARKDSVITPHTINHEKIHTAQMRELWYIPFYIIYVLEWIARLFVATESAYKGMSFEVEAYNNQDNLDYLKERKRFAMWRR